jgi:hypothetical protein
VKASVLPGRVPLGFVCGYPLQGNGELYGGSMFARSAAMDTLQGRAIHSINMKWGNPSTDVTTSAITTAIACHRAPGRETIGIPVCKKKYKPFDFRIVKQKQNGIFTIEVQRLYGCQCHHPKRKNVIEVHGERQGWQPFGAWSLQKAQYQARIEAARLNGELINDISSISSVDMLDDSDEDTTTPSCSVMATDKTITTVRKSISNICLNGTCAWKLKSAYDNIFLELNGRTESDVEDNR